MNKTADDAWVDAAAYRQQHGITHELIKKLRQAVEATAEEIAHKVAVGLYKRRAEDVEYATTRFHELEARVQHLYDMRDEDLQAELANDSTSGVGEQDPSAPSEGEDGEEEPDLPVEAVHAIRSLRASSWHMTADRLSECVAGLQRQLAHTRLEEEAHMDEIESLQRELDEAREQASHWCREANETVVTCTQRMREKDAEIAQLRDPENWKVEAWTGGDRWRSPLYPEVYRVRYVGPDPDSTEADEGESVEGEVFSATNGRKWVWVDDSPFEPGTRVRITKLPETQEDDDGTE